MVNLRDKRTRLGVTNTQHVMLIQSDHKWYLGGLFPRLSQSARHASRLLKVLEPFTGTHFMHLALHGMHFVLNLGRGPLHH